MLNLPNIIPQITNPGIWVYKWLLNESKTIPIDNPARIPLKEPWILAQENNQKIDQWGGTPIKEINLGFHKVRIGINKKVNNDKYVLVILFINIEFSILVPNQ